MPPRSTDDAALAQEIRVLENCGTLPPRLVQGLAFLRELQRLRASKLTEREERLALSALGYWSSDNDYAPHEEIAELRVKLSRPR